MTVVNICEEAILIPSSLFKLDVGLLSLIRLEVNARLEPVHFKCLVDAAFGIQICEAKETVTILTGYFSSGTFIEQTDFWKDLQLLPHCLIIRRQKVRLSVSH